eukprot:TRINITY_DN53447_c0_g1_i1.p1 TRINITY_DN53447_c0_g1~~TRINITY_DN53447_c0_g1_i1.p1  ORF type:complete len:497 (+),score=112.00 TRINITY_DN53447_c0_g1_i1:51-1541(+)
MVNLKDIFCCWSKLLTGQACRFYNVICCPFVLCIWATSIYCCGCVRVYLNRGLYKFCCCLCRAVSCWICCCWSWKYTDKDFPPNVSSLGEVEGDSAAADKKDDGGKFSGKVQWIRAGDFPVDEDKSVAGKYKEGASNKLRMQLFSEEIDSRDICQGALGDCWLLAAIACLCEHPGAIQSVFRSKERNPRGKYALRLYDGQKEKWEILTVDDHIPCNKASYDHDGSCKPLFSRPNKNELYVMLLEKAFAKFCGSYSKLEGGSTIWAIRAMTGDPARLFYRGDDKKDWQRKDLANFDDPKDKRKHGLYAKDEKIDNDTMFETLRKYHSLGSILSASGASGKYGLVTGHAYSILQVRKVNDGYMGIGGKEYKMIEIRNPWGTGEWKGDWSDKSDLWQKHPDVKKRLGFEDRDDGAFWMSWSDFIEEWSRIGVVDRTVDINSVSLHVKDDSACAPTAGCCTGCCRFWCCCQGCKKVYFPHRSSDETIKVKKGCCSGCAIM